jgi:hypothetical protein
MISILKNIIKLNIANIRWGNLSDNDEQLVIKSSFKKVLGASYIRKTHLSYSYIVTLG